MAIGVFPGSFDPLTTAHLAVADAAVAHLGLDRLDLVMSEVALAKEAGAHASLEERVAAIEAAAATGRPWLRARVTAHRLIADIAEGYDACVIGADKWHQLHDPAFYGSTEARDLALARLPPLLVAPRHGVALPPAGADVVVLAIDPAFHEVSSSAVRAGREEWRATP
jgi:nicotinic acid mononucleotide adenylyltransferase